LLEALGNLAELLAHPRDVPRVLGEVLAQCLDGTGFASGLLYLAEPGGVYRLGGEFGLAPAFRAEAVSFFAHPDLLRRVVDSGRSLLLLPGAPEAEPGGDDFLARLGRASALVVPLVVLGHTFGALLLASDERDLADEVWLDFGRGLAAQLGQTLALGQSLTRLAAAEERYRFLNRLAEEKLRDSGERFRLLLDSAAEAIYGIDPDGTCTFANPACARLLGFAGPAALLGRNLHELIHFQRADGSPYPESDCPIQQAPRAGAEVHVADEVFWRADGTSFPVEYWAHPMRRGAARGAVVTFLDTTERRRAEAALHETEQRLRHVVSSSPVVLFSLAVENGHRIARWVSDNIRRLTGDAIEEALKPGWWFSRIHPDDFASARSDLEMLRAENPFVREYRFRDKEGRFLWIRDEQILILDPAGDPLEVLGSWSEVTARKQVEIRLAQSEAQYRLLFDDSPQHMWVFDDETLAFLAVNDAAARHYGYAREEVLALTLRDLQPPAEARLAEERAGWPARNGTRTAFTSPRLWKQRKKDGTLLDVEIALSPIEFRGRAAWLALASDVTEKKRLEAQFLQAQKMDTVGRLAGGVAHDFNNLLTVILGYSQLLATQLGPRSGLRAHVEEIRKAGERAASLTRQLLAFSRRQVLQPQVVEINAAMLDVERMLRRLIGENIELVTRLRSQAGRVLVDPDQVVQVMLNLAVNARDAMPDGGRLILETDDVELAAPAGEATPGGPPAPYVMVAVADDGVGMDAEVQSHLFEPFFTTKERGKGTGLGLSTVYGIVRQSGGRIEVQSEPGRGSTFRIFLPRVSPAEALAAGGTAPPQELPAGAETVLLLEDESALRVLVRTLLERDGHTVLEAETPEAALDLARGHAGPIHLVLTDVVMPGMSGPDVAARIGRLRPESRFLFMSGYPGDVVSQREVLPAGAQVLEKPFTAEALRRKMREELDRRRDGEPAGPALGGVVAGGGKALGPR
jgi:two-component system cell cycle sensor histidine kinase/response regulator CckA